MSDFVARTMGLHFPPERWADLQRGVAGAAEELGFADSVACADWLLSAPLTQAQIQILASHLTIGETYFFRDRKTFDVLAERVLPELVCARRNSPRRLRIWSAGCCTGEEPYSLAILLHRAIPDLADWNVTILATDISARFLEKAAAGVYGEWSFRETPASFKEQYFQRTPEGRYAIAQEIKQRVTFAHLNLAEDVFPSPATNTHSMDLIFCRNVLMYFTLPQARKVIRHLNRALVDDGWLVVSPSEASQVLFSQFVPVNFPGVILYQKNRVEQAKATPPENPSAEFALPTFAPPSPWTPPLSISPPTEASSEVPGAETPVTTPASPVAPEAEGFSQQARAQANEGNAAEALVWCDRWVAADKLDFSGHYVRAMVLEELGELEPARRSLQRAIYLKQDFVLAHFALGHLAHSRGSFEEADKHFANTLRLLGRIPPDDILLESDGLTASGLTEIIVSLTAKGASS